MKTILFLILTCLTFSVSAQAKKDTIKAKPVPAAPKPVYQPDVNKPHDLTLKGITLLQLNDYLVYEQNGPALDSSDKLTGAQISTIKKNAGIVIAVLGKNFVDILADDKAKWQADTAKKIKPTKK